MEITKETKLKDVLEIGTQCKKCGHCCNHASGFLIDGDLDKIAKHFEMLPEDAKEQFMEEVDFYSKKFIKPKRIKGKNGQGSCIFLGDKNECKIQEVKPLQCKICKGCEEHGKELFSWFLLNYCVDVKNPETIRQYAHYLRAGGKVIPGGELKELIKDEKELKKILGTEALETNILKNN